MTLYLVWPTGPGVPLYSTIANPLYQGYSLTADSPEAACRAIMGEDEAHTQRTYVVLGPEGLVAVDLTPLDGCETLSLDEGAHR